MITLAAWKKIMKQTCTLFTEYSTVLDAFKNANETIINANLDINQDPDTPLCYTSEIILSLRILKTSAHPVLSYRFAIISRMV